MHPEARAPVAHIELEGPYEGHPRPVTLGEVEQIVVHRPPVPGDPLGQRETLDPWVVRHEAELVVAPPLREHALRVRRENVRTRIADEHQDVCGRSGGPYLVEEVGGPPREPISRGPRRVQPVEKAGEMVALERLAPVLLPRLSKRRTRLVVYVMIGETIKTLA